MTTIGRLESPREPASAVARLQFRWRWRNCAEMISYRRLAPVLRRDLHEEAVGIPEIDRRAACIGLIRISRFGVRQLAVDFVSEAFGSDPIHMVDCHCEMCDHALLSGH